MPSEQVVPSPFVGTVCLALTADLADIFGDNIYSVADLFSRPSNICSMHALQVEPELEVPVTQAMWESVPGGPLLLCGSMPQHTSHLRLASPPSDKYWRTVPR